MDILTFIVSFFGGGITGALINWIHAEHSNERERKIKFLDNQIRGLYGPLYYFVSQSEKLFELNKRFHDAYNKEYVGQKWSTEEYTRRVLEKDTTETLKIANKYIETVERNNLKIKEILDSHYSLIDPDDIDVFLIFYEHHIRLITEKDGAGRITTPLNVYQHIGDISFLRPEVIKRAKEKFLKKKQELDRLVRR